MWFRLPLTREHLISFVRTTIKILAGRINSPVYNLQTYSSQAVDLNICCENK